MEPEDLPAWAVEFLGLRRDRRGLPTEWEEDSSERFSRIIHIAYPNGVFYVVDKLTAQEDGPSQWVELDGHHYVEATAVSTAQKKAYYSDIPHRVRQVVWNS